jgi:hypothetical protein
VGGRRVREIRRRARVRTRRSTASAEGVELIGQAHGAEREEKGCAGQRLGDWRSGPARQRESAGGRKRAPTDRPHWVASERGRARAREKCR